MFSNENLMEPDAGARFLIRYDVTMRRPGDRP